MKIPQLITQKRDHIHATIVKGDFESNSNLISHKPNSDQGNKWESLACIKNNLFGERDQIHAMLLKGI